MTASLYTHQTQIWYDKFNKYAFYIENYSPHNRIFKPEISINSPNQI